MSNTLAIQLFLQRLKALVTEGKVVFQPRNRRKSREFMLEHGLTEEDILAVLGSLRPEHYRKGPEADHDGSAGSVYVFVCPYEQFRLEMDRLRESLRPHAEAAGYFSDEDVYRDVT